MKHEHYIYTPVTKRGCLLVFMLGISALIFVFILSFYLAEIY